MSREDRDETQPGEVWRGDVHGSACIVGGERGHVPLWWDHNDETWNVAVTASLAFEIAFAYAADMRKQRDAARAEHAADDERHGNEQAAMYLRAIRAEAERDDARAEVASLRAKIDAAANAADGHLYVGFCPEYAGDPMRDPACPLCAILPAPVLPSAPMNVTEDLIALLRLADATPTEGGGVRVPGLAAPLYLGASDRAPNTWALGFASPGSGGHRVSADTLTELQGAEASATGGCYYDRNMRRRWLVSREGWAVGADLPDLPPPPPPP